MFGKMFEFLGQVHTWASLTGMPTLWAICYNAIMPTQKKVPVSESDMQPQQRDSPT